VIERPRRTHTGETISHGWDEAHPGERSHTKQEASLARVRSSHYVIADKDDPELDKRPDDASPAAPDRTALTARRYLMKVLVAAVVCGLGVVIAVAVGLPGWVGLLAALVVALLRDPEDLARGLGRL